MSYYLFYRNFPKFYGKSIEVYSHFLISNDVTRDGSSLPADVTVEIDKKMFLFLKKISIGHYSGDQWLI